jgi:hypothetical protein
MTALDSRIARSPNRADREVNQRQKEEYFRDYALLKAEGKPFSPYAVAKDAAMASS